MLTAAKLVTGQHDTNVNSSEIKQIPSWNIWVLFFYTEDWRSDMGIGIRLHNVSAMFISSCHCSNMHVSKWEPSSNISTRMFYNILLPTYGLVTYHIPSVDDYNAWDETPQLVDQKWTNYYIECANFLTLLTTWANQHLNLHWVLKIMSL